MWTERGAVNCCVVLCCVVVWQITVGVESFDTTQEVWLITLWGGGGRGKMDSGWLEL